MSGYAKTTWTDGVTTLGPTNMQHLEDAVYDLKTRAYNTKDYGAAGDGTTDDTTAVSGAQTAATAAGAPVFFPAGTYKTTTAASSFTGPWRGVGRPIDSGSHKRAPWFSAVSTAPASTGTWTSVTSAFDGDLSKVQLAMEHRVTGSTTLTQPTTGYVDNQECAPIALYLYNESGWNQNTGSNDGRTGLAAIYSRVYQNGQGDLACYNANAFVTGAKASATSWLANPAGVLYNGIVTGGQAGVYLNPFELHLTDNGFDVAGIGGVYSFNRTVATGALDAMWNGLRLQNKGSQAVDVGVMLTNNGSGNGFLVGLDFASAGFATSGTWINAAITMSADQRIYLNATGTDSGASIYRRPSSTGTTYIKYDSGISGINIVVGNASTLQLKANIITAAQNFQMATGKVYMVNGVQVVTTRQTGWTASTGAALRTGWDTSSVTLTQLAQTVKALIDDLFAHGLIGA